MTTTRSAKKTMAEHRRPVKPPSGTRKILIVAGEASGDAHGARLVENLLRIRPDLSIYGIGGDAMERAGVRLSVHISRLSVMGIVEIVGRLREIFSAYRTVKLSLDRDRPDLVVLIDFPDFNLRVARQAAKRRIPVVYYISPQVWAWRRGRIRQISRRVSHMIVIFPFEKDLYERHGVPVTYVGHPLMDRWDRWAGSESEMDGYAALGLSPLYPVLGLLPGSRASEVRSLLPVMIQSAEAIRRRYPRLQVLIGEAPGLDPKCYDRILAESKLPVKRLQSGIGPAMRMCDLAVVASGTATLEVALCKVPMVVVYRVSRFTYLLGRLLVRVPCIGMVNLITQRTIVPELLQKDVNEERLVEHCMRFLTNATYYFSVKRELAAVRDLLGKPGASERAARIITRILSSRTMNERGEAA